MRVRHWFFLEFDTTVKNKKQNNENKTNRHYNYTSIGTATFNPHGVTTTRKHHLGPHRSSYRYANTCWCQMVGHSVAQELQAVLVLCSCTRTNHCPVMTYPGSGKVMTVRSFPLYTVRFLDEGLHAINIYIHRA